MMDLQTIREFQAEAAAQAARNKLEPYLAEADDVGRLDRLRRIPNLGTYLPTGWARVDASSFGHDNGRGAGSVDGVPYYFVDKSGFGTPCEPALTARQFADRVKPGYGYAIVEEGQFQVGIGMFKRLPNRGKRANNRD